MGGEINEQAARPPPPPPTPTRRRPYPHPGLRFLNLDPSGRGAELTYGVPSPEANAINVVLPKVLLGTAGVGLTAAFIEVGGPVIVVKGIAAAPAIIATNEKLQYAKGVAQGVIGELGSGSVSLPGGTPKEIAGEKAGRFAAKVAKIIIKSSNGP